MYTSTSGLEPLCDAVNCVEIHGDHGHRLARSSCATLPGDTSDEPPLCRRRESDAPEFVDFLSTNLVQLQLPLCADPYNCCSWRVCYSRVLREGIVYIK